MNAGEGLGEPKESRGESGSELDDRKVIGEDRIWIMGVVFQEGIRPEGGVGWGQVVSQTSFLGS